MISMLSWTVPVAQRWSIHICWMDHHLFPAWGNHAQHHTLVRGWTAMWAEATAFDAGPLPSVNGSVTTSFHSFPYDSWLTLHPKPPLDHRIQCLTWNMLCAKSVRGTLCGSSYRGDQARAEEALKEWDLAPREKQMGSLRMLKTTQAMGTTIGEPHGWLQSSLCLEINREYLYYQRKDASPTQ